MWLAGPRRLHLWAVTGPGSHEGSRQGELGLRLRAAPAYGLVCDMGSGWHYCQHHRQAYVSKGSAALQHLLPRTVPVSVHVGRLA